MATDIEDYWNDPFFESANQDPDLAYEVYRDKVLDGHPTGCTLIKCLCGKGTPYDPPKDGDG